MSHRLHSSTFLSRALLVPLLTFGIAVQPLSVLALPSGGQVAQGNADISQPDATTMNITQHTNKAILNWQDFSIQADETTNFIQPNAASVALNRVVGVNPSQILGKLNANGQVFLVNPNGVIFGHNAQVDVAGLVATTANITNDNFMAGHYAFNQPSTNPAAGIVNHGQITVAQTGVAALVAPHVLNNGVISAKLGKVALAAGTKFTLDFYGDGLIQLAANDTISKQTTAVDGTPLNGNVDQMGEVEGAHIYMSAAAAQNALDSVVNMDGLLTAKADNSGGTVQVSAHGGKVVIGDNAVIVADGANAGGVIEIGGGHKGQGNLENALVTHVADGAIITASAQDNGNGGDVTVWADDATRYHGAIKAEGGPNGGDGGYVEVSAKNLTFAGEVSTRAPQGKQGTLLIDPTNITITDGAGGADDAEVTGDGTVNAADGGATDFTIAEQALEGIAAGTDITLEANNNITINDLSDDTLGLATTGNVTFTADADSSGAGAFSMNAGDTISTAGANLTISGQTLSVGILDTSSGSGGAIDLTASGGITLNGNLTTDAANIDLNSATTLATGAIQLSTGAGGGNIAFDNLLNGAQALTLNAGTGTVTTSGATGSSTPLSSFSATGSGGINVQGIITSGAQDFTGATTLNADLTTTNSNIDFNSAVTLATGAIQIDSGAGAGDITFDATIDGAQDLTVDAGTGGVTFSGNIGATTDPTALDVTGNTISLQDVDTVNNQSYTGTTTINTDLTSSAGSIAVTGASTLAAAAVITTGGGAGDDVTFSNGITGDFTLEIAAGASGDLTLGNGADVDTLTLTSGNLVSLAGTVTTDAAQDWTNFEAITLTGTAAMNATDGSGGRTDITFDAANTIDGGSALTLTADDVALVNAIGGSTPLASLSVNANGATGITVDVAPTTTGDQDYTGTSVVNVDMASGGAMTFSGDVTIGAARQFTTGGADADDFTLTGTIDDDFNVTINTGANGDMSFGTFDVNTLNLSGDDVTIAGDITTDTALDFTSVDDITISGARTLTATDGAGGNTNITFDSANAVNGTGDLNLVGDTVTLFTMGGGTALGGLEVTGASGISLNGNITTSNDAIDFNNAVTLAASVQIDSGSGAGNITFDNTVEATSSGSQNLTVDAGTGNVTFSSNIGGSTEFGTVTVDGTNISLQAVGSTGNQAYTASGATTLNTDISSGAAITFNGDVTLAADRVITSGGAAGEDITITGDVDDDFNLTLNAGAAGDIAVAGLDINTLALSGNLMTLNGDITTDTAQSYTGVNAITLGTASVLTATDGAAGRTDITLDSANTINGNFALTLDGDTVTAYRIGNSTPVASFAATGATDINLNGAITTNNGNMDFNSAVTLAISPLTLSTGGGGAGNITFDSTVNGTSALTLTAGTGSITGSGAIGGSTALTSLAASGSGGLNFADVTTTGTQDYTGATTLNGTLTTTNSSIDLNSAVTLATGAVEVTSGSGAGDITFDSTINGGQALTLNAGTGVLTLSGVVGGSTPITSLAATGTGGISALAITSTGTQAFTGATTLNGDINTTNSNVDFNSAVTLATGAIEVNTSTGAGDITFDSTINGAQALTLEAGTGAITISGAAGGSTALSSLTANGSGGINVQAVTTSGAQAYTGATTLNGDITTSSGDADFNSAVTLATGDIEVNTSTGNNDITFDSTIDGAQNLTLSAGTGTVTLSGAVGGSTPLTSLTISSDVIGLPAVTTTGTQTYNGTTSLSGDLTSSGSAITFAGATTLLAAVTVDSNNGKIDFQNTLNGAFDLTLDSGSGNLEFDADVGGSTRLSDVTVNQAANITFGGTTRLASFTQSAGTGTTDFGTASGIDATGNIEVQTPSNIAGNIITAQDVVLKAENDVSGNINARSLTLTANTATLFGTINGNTDRDAAQAVTLGRTTPGPYLFNGYAMPVVGDVIAPDVPETTSTDNAASGNDGTVQVTVNVNRDIGTALNPFVEDYRLVQTSNDDAYNDVGYLQQDLWDFVRSDGRDFTFENSDVNQPDENASLSLYEQLWNFGWFPL